MSVRLREAGPGDELVIVQLIDELGGDQTGSSLTPSFVTTFLSHTGCGALIAEDDGLVVGLASYSLLPGLLQAACTCSIHELIVRDFARHRGIGTMLVTEMTRRAASWGCSAISVCTRVDDGAARALYRSCGFTGEGLLLERHFPGHVRADDPASQRMTENGD